MSTEGMSNRILVVGDANVDLVLTGDVVPRFGQAEQLLDGASLVLGGSASIVASGLAKLGVDTHLVAVVGDDEFGAFTRKALERAGVGVGSIVIDPHAATGISVILSAPGDRSILTAVGALPMLRPEHVRTAVERLSPAHVHFASYFLLPDLAAGLPELLGWLGDRAITTSVDTNWDPAEEWTGLAAVLAAVDILLPNLEELRAIAGVVGARTATDELLAAELGPIVVVKAGAAGGFSVAGGGSVSRSPGLSVDVVDTTGAGDSFDAGYLAALADGITDETSRLRWATIAGSLSTRAVGGTAAQATRVELDAELNRMTTR
jgi:ribokinase